MSKSLLNSTKMAKTLACKGIIEEKSTCFVPHITLRLNFDFLYPTTTSPTHSITTSHTFPSSPLMSYDMCTENLGNETGCEMTETTMLPYTNNESSPTEIIETKKSVSRRLPPPLTTMSGAKSIIVSPYREDGRLVIKAMRSPSAMFRTERSHGRLRMCILGSYDDDDEELQEVDEGEMTCEEVEEEMLVKVEGPGGRCKQGKPQDSRLFNWEPFNWVATT